MSYKTKSATKPPAFEVSKFNIEKFSVSLTPEAVTKQDAAKKPKMPYYAIPKYAYVVKGNSDDGKEVIAQPVCMTGDIKLVAYGIPQNQKNLAEGEEPYYPTEKDRSFFKIPLDPEQLACAELLEMVQSLDEYMVNGKNKKKLLSGVPEDRISKYEYSALNKEPSEKMKEPRYNFLKVHLDVDYETGEIMTQLFVKQPNGKNEVQQITCLKDVEKYFRWGCTFRCAIMVQKMWASKAKMMNKYSYGLGAKCMQIIIKEPGAGGNSTKDAYRSFMFDDEGEVDSEETPVAPAPKALPKAKPDVEKHPVKVIKAVVPEPEEDDTDSDTESDEEETPPSPKKPTPKKDSPKKKESSEEDDSEEDSVKKSKQPVKKTLSKKISSDDEDEKPKSKIVKKQVKVTKPKKPSSDDDDDEDDDKN
jgi:DNA polymerase III gamma/tau subunit